MTNDQGYTPIHLAVYHANVIALEIIKDHLASLGQELDPNFAGPGAPLPLDGIGLIRKNLLLKEEDEPYLYTILKKNTAETYAFIRNLGGCLVFEREGTMVWYVQEPFPYISFRTNIYQRHRSYAERAH